MGKNTRILDESGNHASRERKTRYTVIHKSLCYLIVKTDFYTILL